MNTRKLKGKMVEKGMSTEILAAELGVTRSTVYRKLSAGKKITIGEAQKIKDALDLTNEEASEIFFGK